MEQAPALESRKNKCSTIKSALEKSKPHAARERVRDGESRTGAVRLKIPLGMQAGERASSPSRPERTSPVSGTGMKARAQARVKLGGITLEILASQHGLRPCWDFCFGRIVMRKAAFFFIFSIASNGLATVEPLGTMFDSVQSIYESKTQSTILIQPEPYMSFQTIYLPSTIKIKMANYNRTFDCSNVYRIAWKFIGRSERQVLNDLIVRIGKDFLESEVPSSRKKHLTLSTEKVSARGEASYRGYILLNSSGSNPKFGLMKYYIKNKQSETQISICVAL